MPIREHARKYVTSYPVEGHTYEKFPPANKGIYFSKKPLTEEVFKERYGAIIRQVVRLNNKIILLGGEGIEELPESFRNPVRWYKKGRTVPDYLKKANAYLNDVLVEERNGKKVFASRRPPDRPKSHLSKQILQEICKVTYEQIESLEKRAMSLGFRKGVSDLPGNFRDPDGGYSYKHVGPLLEKWMKLHSPLLQGGDGIYLKNGNIELVKPEKPHIIVFDIDGVWTNTFSRELISLAFQLYPHMLMVRHNIDPKYFPWLRQSVSSRRNLEELSGNIEAVRMSNENLYPSRLFKPENLELYIDSMDAWNILFTWTGENNFVDVNSSPIIKEPRSISQNSWNSDLWSTTNGDDLYMHLTNWARTMLIYLANHSDNQHLKQLVANEELLSQELKELHRIARSVLPPAPLRKDAIEALDILEDLQKQGLIYAAFISNSNGEEFVSQYLKATGRKEFPFHIEKEAQKFRVNPNWVFTPQGLWVKPNMTFPLLYEIDENNRQIPVYIKTRRENYYRGLENIIRMAYMHFKQPIEGIVDMRNLQVIVGDSVDFDLSLPIAVRNQMDMAGYKNMSDTLYTYLITTFFTSLWARVHFSQGTKDSDPRNHNIFSTQGLVALVQSIAAELNLNSQMHYLHPEVTPIRRGIL